MLKATEQNDRLKRAVLLSIVLHCVLIAVLFWGSLHPPQKSSASGGSSIDAVMIDPDAVVQQYNRQQQLRYKQAQQQVEELQQKQAAKQLAEAQAKQVAAAEAKKQVEAEKDTAAKKAVAQDAKPSSDVDALLGVLTKAKNAPKAGDALAGGGDGKAQSGASGAEIDAYKAQVSRAISDKFYDSSSYSGRTCDLRIKLAPDGLLISVTAGDGDPELCQAAVSAAKLATIPRPPSPQVYEVFKNATLGFSPQ